MQVKYGSPPECVRTMAVLGSGGHTTEMLTLMEALNRSRYTPRCYVVADTDSLSAARATEKERNWGTLETMQMSKIPRSREVGQPFVTSVWTTLYAFFWCVKLVWDYKPQLLLLNGPGTCIPVCVMALMFRLMGLMDLKIVYFESIARVSSLSLSGKIIYQARMADVFLVQWETLLAKYPRAKCLGRLF
ncbi:unnamed protein product [Ostreobium quekettii]|uniref:UDP-N-acetylglucosamine transferase subunit ALG14 n=1 Tax=Ostreobium quekettii TaxID=121088 RepID=A0A8S1IWC1_9CHLO|nr:unnamed protein product [Ostreobium quekettii]|eukprot:evm.model.scf_633.9 EVM.evm.TU.scf_633.9   scf_633:70288-73598(-)